MTNKVFRARIAYHGILMSGLPTKENDPYDTYKSMLEEFTTDCKWLLRYVKRHGGIDYFSIDKKISKGTDGNYRAYELDLYVSEANNGGCHSISLEMKFYDDQ